MRGRSRVALFAAIVALCFSIAANIGGALRSYQNCQSIEIIKARIYNVANESLTDLKSGKNDVALQNLYGMSWEQEKEKLIADATARLHRFDPDTCNYFS